MGHPGDEGLAGMDNPGLEPLKMIGANWTLVWQRQSDMYKINHMAATRDNNHVDDKLLNEWMDE